jgi:hypothetical protein
MNTSWASFLTPNRDALHEDVLLKFDSSRAIVHTLGVEHAPPKDAPFAADRSTCIYEATLLLASTKTMRATRAEINASTHNKTAYARLLLGLRGARLLGTRAEVDRTAEIAAAMEPKASSDEQEPSPLVATLREQSGVDLRRPSPTKHTTSQGEVVLVGGGPQNLALATLLLDAGFEVTMYDNSVKQQPDGTIVIENAGIAAAGQVIHFPINFQKAMRTNLEAIKAEKRLGQWVSQTTRVNAKLGREYGVENNENYVDIDPPPPHEQLWSKEIRHSMATQSHPKEKDPLRLPDPNDLNVEIPYDQPVSFTTQAIDTPTFNRRLHEELSKKPGFKLICRSVTPAEVEAGLGTGEEKKVVTVTAVGPGIYDMWGLSHHIDKMTEGYSVRLCINDLPEPRTDWVGIAAGPYVLNHHGGTGTVDDPHIIAIGGVSTKPANIERDDNGNILPPKSRPEMTNLLLDVGKRMSARDFAGFSTKIDKKYFDREYVVDGSERAGYRAEHPDGPKLSRDGRHGFEHVIHNAFQGHTGYSTMWGTARELLAMVVTLSKELGQLRVSPSFTTPDLN